MVEFRFDIKGLFPQPIVRVTSNLLPHTFRGDRRQSLDATSKMSEIIDRLGQLSAVSQKLAKPVTTAQKLRMSENQVIYLMADPDAGHNGLVIGLLKVGTKDLYLFDEAGQTRKIDKAPCILDFYIHESRQRAGLGRELFEAMLAEEHWTPIKCSVDRPSEKLLGFLKKHYGLVRIIPQANNFVLYEGFFDNGDGKSSGKHQTNGMHITNSPNTQLFGAHYLGDDVDRRRMRQLEASKLGTQITQISPVGRYGARRPTCSMAEIIHNNSTPNKGGAESSSLVSPTHHTTISEAVDAMTSDLEELRTAVDEHISADADLADNIRAHDNIVAHMQAETNVVNHVRTEAAGLPSLAEVAMDPEPVEGYTPPEPTVKKTSTFHLSKQHTGMKNMSFGVGNAVSPNTRMDFDQKDHEDFGKIEGHHNYGHGGTQDNADAMSTVSSTEGYTDQGYHDLKFFHNKLW